MKCPGIRGSHIDWFLRCPLYYKYVAHDKRPPDIMVPAWSVTGWIMHKTLEIAIQEGISARKAFMRCCQREKEIVREEVAQSWPDYPLADEEIPSMSGKNMLRAQTMLTNFERMRPKLFEPGDTVKLETPFKVCLDLKHDIWYWGRIDVLIFKRSTGMIDNLDYKSTKPEYEYSKVPPQLLRYCMGFSLQSGIPMKRMRSILFNLESGNMPTRTWTSKEANAMIDEIVDVVLKIREMPPEKAPGRVGSHCKLLCQYHPSCPAYAEAIATGKKLT
jgi:hypothetical protein